MAYSMNHGLENDGMDNTQRGLLIGLPAIALMLSFGAVHKHNAPNPTITTHTIPVTSTLSVGSRSGGTNASGSGQAGGSSGTSSSSSPTPSGTSGSVASANPPASTASSGSTGGSTVVGGRGGGPTGGGVVSLPDCSIGQVATVNCQVTSCSPTIDLSPGQKAILGVNGTCVIVN